MLLNLVAHAGEEFTPTTPITTGKTLLPWYLAVLLISVLVLVLALACAKLTEDVFVSGASKKRPRKP